MVLGCRLLINAWTNIHRIFSSRRRGLLLQHLRKQASRLLQASAFWWIKYCKTQARKSLNGHFDKCWLLFIQSYNIWWDPLKGGKWCSHTVVYLFIYYRQKTRIRECLDLATKSHVTAMSRHRKKSFGLYFNSTKICSYSWRESHHKLWETFQRHICGDATHRHTWGVARSGRQPNIHLVPPLCSYLHITGPLIER